MIHHSKMNILEKNHNIFRKKYYDICKINCSTSTSLMTSLSLYLFLRYIVNKIILHNNINKNNKINKSIY